MTDAPESKARINITVRLLPSGLAAIDSLRGGWSRSEYVRAALADWVSRKKQGPAKGVEL